MEQKRMTWDLIGKKGNISLDFWGGKCVLMCGADGKTARVEMTQEDVKSMVAVLDMAARTIM